MPRSDTWPGSVAMETTVGLDSAGSCDSVVSNQSNFSDDSLEHLSAEERACLMFLEETIESLEAEDDSGLSNDDPEPLQRSTGGLAARIAMLSSVMARSRPDNPSKAYNDHKQEMTKEQKPLPSYRVATPLILTKTNSLIPSGASAAPTVPQKPNRRSEPLSNRRLLSNQGVMELPKSMSTKQTDGSDCKSSSRPFTAPHASKEVPVSSRINPPAVPPKPKWHPPSSLPPSGSTQGVENTANNAHRVRNEALLKLGLLKASEISQGPSPGTSPPISFPRGPPSGSSLDSRLSSPQGKSSTLTVCERTISPAHSRSSRPRPSSLGNKVDFEDIQSQKTPEKEETKKRLHPRGISVQIKPNSRTEQERQEALKKLGLLKIS